jgi:NAD(P)-dependent dehydrogenase (short-subunit alcohol dehydrogenase family)
MPRPLEQAVVVITGASSGIGRAAALRIARRGGSLALCARGEEPLAAVAAECEAAGAAVLQRAVDVAEEQAVEDFAAAVEDRFGRIDVWVNNAATMAYGTFDDIPSKVFRGVVETSLMGQVHGARAALRRFRRQGSGVLINMSSIWGRIPSPQVTPYVVSKHGVRALTECLQAELADEPEIHVTALMPQAVDTPIFEHAGDYTGRQVRPIPPVLDAEKVAAGIEACAEDPKLQVSYGLLGRALELLHVAAPPLYRRVAHPAFVRGTRGQLRADPATGNVLGSSAPHRIDGGWRTRRRGAPRRAFLAAAGGGVSGILRRNS